MYISSVQQNNNRPSFNALYVNKKTIERSFGPKVLKKIEQILPSIKERSVDVDTFIYADHLFAFNRNNVICVTVQKPNITFKDRFLSFFSLRPPYAISEFVFPNMYMMSNHYGKEDLLYEAFDEAKSNLAVYM